MIFGDFPENDDFDNTYFHENLKKNVKNGEFAKIRKSENSP